MLSKILNYYSVHDREMIADEEDEKENERANESESFNLLLNQPEANALKSGHCMKDDCNICKALNSFGESQSSVVLPVPARDCRELEKDSNISLGICRICHCNPETLPELGPLQSVCNCRGTVALVHMSCLERWLAESDSSSCELCRYQFTVQRIPKHGAFESVFIWANEVADFNQLCVESEHLLLFSHCPSFINETKCLAALLLFSIFCYFHQSVVKNVSNFFLDPDSVQKDICFITTFPLILTLLRVAVNTIAQLVLHSIFCTELRPRACAGINCFLLLTVKLIHFNLKFKLLMDTVWFWLMTPLAAMAGYIFIRAASELIDDSFPTDAPWLMGALLVNSCLTLVAYYGWVMTSVRRHVSSWYHWWRTADCIIKVQLPPGEHSKVKREVDETDSTEITPPSSQS